MNAPVAIDVAICTHNGAVRLPAVLSALAAQRVTKLFDWSVLVVDNASTDGTAGLVENWIERDLLPRLRLVREDRLGLTPARLRAVRETAAPWIAFVDDDNLPERGWLNAIARTIRLRPDAGGVGGRVILDWEDAPPPDYLSQFGFCFAEQDRGDELSEVENLAGAGMVLRRSALVRSGWLDGPLVRDREGKSLISGGDVEIAQRIRAAGCPLLFTPAAVLHHRIPRERTTRRYLFKITYQLGFSAAVIHLLGWAGDWKSWQASALARGRYWASLAATGLYRAARHRTGFTAAIAWCCFAAGVLMGVRRCLTLNAARRGTLLGAAAIRG